MKRVNWVPITFLLLSLLGLYYSDMSPTFVTNEVITRFIRDGIMILALILPITAGMGINFAVTVGAMSAQIGLLTVIILQIKGFPGLALALLVGVLLSIILGYIIGVGLNRVKGREMIATIIIGFLANGIYQLIFLAGYGTWIKPLNQEIILSRGVGVRNMVDLVSYRHIMDQLWTIEVGKIELPIFMILVVILACLTVAYLMNTRFGQRIKAVGLESSKASLLGIDVNRARIQAIIASMVIACIGQLIFLQNIGMLNVYTAHLNTDVFSAAALLAGGATIKEARVRNMVFGVFLFHALFIVSPQAGQNLFGNAALGEYFRSFVAYGTIALALVLNVQRQNVARQKNRQTGF
ncbi:MAG: ABC transporter permease subunit [Ignavibacteriales bacterium]